MRLTDKTSVEFTPECSKVNPLTTQGKCPYYEKLREFEDFMEEQEFESLGELESVLYQLNVEASKTKELEKENQALKERWEKLKDYVNTPKEFQEWREEMEITVDSIKAKMKELELADLIAKKEK